MTNKPPTLQDIRHYLARNPRADRRQLQRYFKLGYQEALSLLRCARAHDQQDPP